MNMRLAEYFDDETPTKPKRKQKERVTTWYQKRDVQRMAAKIYATMILISEPNEHDAYQDIPAATIAERVGVAADNETFRAALKFLTMDTRETNVCGLPYAKPRHFHKYLYGTHRRDDYTYRLQQFPLLP